MVTSKSTVVGIRLDHDRRAWVEAEAARRGVSVRGLFEGMIDGARTGGTAADAGRDAAGSYRVFESVDDANAPEFPGDSENDADPTAAATETVNTSAASVYTTAPPPLGSSDWLDLRSVATLPGGLIRGAITLTTGLIKSSSRCALNRLDSCPMTKHWSGRSV